MPDLVIDRALGYVNLLLLLFFFLAPLLLGFHCNFSPLFSPLLWWAQEMAWSQVKTEATMWYIIRSRTAQKFRIVNWVLRPNRSRHVFAFQSPPTFHKLRTEEAKERKKKTKFIRFPWLDMIAIVSQKALTDRLPGQLRSSSFFVPFFVAFLIDVVVENSQGIG